jgi:hypothetical protein
MRQVIVRKISVCRTAAAQLDHMHRVRVAWLYYFRTGERPEMGGYDKAAVIAPSRERLFYRP